VDTYHTNNTICQELARRVLAIREFLERIGFEGQESIAKSFGTSLQNLRDVLKDITSLEETFRSKGWIKQLILAKKYDQEFIRLERRLLGFENDMHLAFSGTTYLGMQDKDIEKILTKFKKELVDVVMSRSQNVDEIVDMTQEEQLKVVAELNLSDRATEITKELSYLKSLKTTNNRDYNRLAAGRLSRVSRPPDLNPLPKGSFTVDRSEEGLLGQGSFGAVYRGRYNGKDVAVKLLNLAREMENDFNREVNSLSGLQKCSNIIRFYGFAKILLDHPYTALVFERCSRSLMEAIHDLDFSLPFETRIRYLTQIVEGMSFLAQEGVVHRDLKPDNILITATDNMAITDFGFASTKSSIMRASKMTEIVGTPGYMAPEVLLESKYSEFSDVFAFGVIASYMLSREDPWKGALSIDIERSIRSRNYLEEQYLLLPTIEEFAPIMSSEFISILNRCCEVTYLDRPRFFEILNVFVPEQVTISSDRLCFMLFKDQM